jgi:hypothetical protein
MGTRATPEDQISPTKASVDLVSFFRSRDKASLPNEGSRPHLCWSVTLTRDQNKTRSPWQKIVDRAVVFLRLLADRCSCAAIRLAGARSESLEPSTPTTGIHRAVPIRHLLKPKISLVELEDLTKKFACEVSTLPANVVLAGWSMEDDGWFCGPKNRSRMESFARVLTTIEFLSKHLVPILSHRSFWFLLCFWDGWRERHLFSDHFTWAAVHNLDSTIEWRGGRGELPILSSNRRWIACFCAHRGDPSALILPEPHYLCSFGYAATFSFLRRHQIPWEAKADRAIFAGGDHGEVANYFPPLVPGRPHPRQYLRHIAEAAGLDVYLDKRISLREQLNYKWILDVDGFVRTWDAFAWKMRSGSAILSAASPWESFFTRLFKPWVHYVPIANDFADLTEKLDWCCEHDQECKQIAQRAQQQAEVVYQPEYVARAVAEQWRIQLESADLIL